MTILEACIVTLIVMCFCLGLAVVFVLACYLVGFLFLLVISKLAEFASAILNPRSPLDVLREITVNINTKMKKNN